MKETKETKEMKEVEIENFIFDENEIGYKLDEKMISDIEVDIRNFSIDVGKLIKETPRYSSYDENQTYIRKNIICNVLENHIKHIQKEDE